MDREILFRGKRLDNGKWLYWNQFGECTEPFLTDECMCSHNSEEYVNPKTVGQYTGLIDKNGVKIFEGDICKDSMGRTFAVEWDSDNARFIGYTTDVWDINSGKYVHGERRICYVGREPKVEVTSNIHEQEAQNET